MMRRTPDLPERRRGELKHTVGSQRLSSALDAQRRLNAWRAEDTRTKAPPVVGSERPPPRVPDAILRLAGPADAAFQMSRARPAHTARKAKPIRSGIYAPSAARSWSQSATWLKSSGTTHG